MDTRVRHSPCTFGKLSSLSSTGRSMHMCFACVALSYMQRSSLRTCLPSWINNFQPEVINPFSMIDTLVTADSVAGLQEAVLQG